MRRLVGNLTFKMQVTDVLEPKKRNQWRKWLESNGTKETAKWVVVNSEKVTYLELVEEALCFGWIDGVVKKWEKKTVQRFTPRRKKSHWTELNKERCRRLIKLGHMHETGKAVLPDLEQKFVIPDYVIEELKKDDEIWNNFEKMPELYKRIRISNMVEHKERDEETFNKKLENFKKKTKLNKLIHTNWHDNEKLLNY